MGHSDVHAEIRIKAPMDLIFQHMTDHEGMTLWPGISSVRLLREGKPRNGVGAVRQIKMPMITLCEEILEFHPPHRYDYKIVKGMPVRHHGTVALVQQGPEVLVTWDITLDSRVPLVSMIFGRALNAGLPPGLAYVKEQCERIVATAPKAAPARPGEQPTAGGFEAF